MKGGVIMKKYFNVLMILLVFGFASIGNAESQLEALHGIKGVSVNLKITDKAKRKVSRKYLNKKELLSYTEDLLSSNSTLRDDRDFRLFNRSDRKLEMKIIVEDKPNKTSSTQNKTVHSFYYITVKALLRNKGFEWTCEKTNTWDESKYFDAIAVGERKVKEALLIEKNQKKTVRLEATILSSNAKQNLEFDKRVKSMPRVAEKSLSLVISRFVIDYRIAKRIKVSKQEKQTDKTKP